MLHRRRSERTRRSRGAVALVALAATAVPLLPGTAAAGGIAHYSEIARVNAPARGLDDLVATNARGDAAVLFRRGRVTYVKSREAGGTWSLAHRVAGEVSPAAVTVDRQGLPTVFWHDGALATRTLRDGEWTRKVLPGGVAAPHLAVDNGAGDSLAAAYLTAGELRVAFRLPDGTWRASQVLDRTGVAPGSFEVGVDERGRATVAWVATRDGRDVVRVAESGEAGRFGSPRTVSATDASVVDGAVDLDVADDGTAALGWLQDGEAGQTMVRMRRPDGVWQATVGLDLPVTAPEVGAASGGAGWVVGRSSAHDGVVLASSRTAGEWSAAVTAVDSPVPVGDVRLTTSGQGSAVLTYQAPAEEDGTYQLGVTHVPAAGQTFAPAQAAPVAGQDAAYSVAVTGAGDAVVALTGERPGESGDLLKYLYAVPYDVTGPVTRLQRPAAAFTRGREMTAEWRALDTWSAVTGYRVRGLEWDPDGTGRRVFLVVPQTPSRKVEALGELGRSYCFQVRAADALDNTGAWSHRRCTAVPLNDRNLSRVGAWRSVRSDGSYQDDVLRSRRRGAALWAPVATRRVALLATRAPGNGEVAVYLGTRLLRRVSLDADRVRRHVRIPVASFDRRVSGRLRVVVTSQGRPVSIDGLATSVW
jgi:hypothetical protein